MTPSKFEGTGRARGCGGGFKTLLSLDLNYLSTPPPKKNHPRVASASHVVLGGYGSHQREERSIVQRLNYLQPKAFLSSIFKEIIGTGRKIEYRILRDSAKARKCLPKKERGNWHIETMQIQ